jgi:hypothetical protein
MSVSPLNSQRCCFFQTPDESSKRLVENVRASDRKIQQIVFITMMKVFYALSHADQELEMGREAGVMCWVSGFQGDERQGWEREPPRSEFAAGRQDAR